MERFIDITIHNADGTSYTQTIDRNLTFKVQEIKLANGVRKHTCRVGQGIWVYGSEGERYTVYMFRGRAFSCTCRHSAKGGKTCKHMKAIEAAFSEKKAEAPRTPATMSPELAAIMPDPIKLAEQRRKRREEGAAAERELDGSLGLHNLMRRGWSA